MVPVEVQDVELAVNEMILSTMSVPAEKIRRMVFPFMMDLPIFKNEK